MITYDYRCLSCGHEQITSSTYEKRDEPKVCDICGEEATRVFTSLNVRTPKISKSFLAPTSAGDGRGEKQRGMLSDLKKADAAEREALNHRPGSTERQGLLNEAKEYKKIRRK